MGRTTVILAVIAASILAFILFFERGAISSRQLEERKGRVFSDFIRDRVNRIEIERKGRTIVLSRGRQPDELDLGTWVVEKPFSAKADQERIEAVLGALEWLDAKRSFERLSEGDRKQFGFSKPALRVWYTLDNKRVAFVVGKPDSLGQGYYLQTDNASEAFVVAKDFVEALDRDPLDFHTKAIHSGVSTYATASVTLRDEEGERVVEKRGDDWWMIKPTEAIASRAVIEEILKGLDEIKGSRFIADPPGDLTKYGLETPVFEVVVREGSKDDGKPSVALDLRVGSHCGDHQNESFVAAGRPGSVMCVADEALAKVRKNLGVIRDKRLLTLEDDTVKSVSIEEAERRLELTKVDSQWFYKATAEGKTTANGQADPAAVSDWFKALRAIKAESFLPADPKTLYAKQIRTPRNLLTFERTGESKKSLIKVGARENHQVFIRRAEEPAIGVFTGSASPLLSASYYRFRKLQLLDEKESELFQIQAQRGAAVESVTKKADTWSVEQPTQIEADHTVMSDLVKLLSKLQAVRFVADAADSRHGLEKPAVTLTARFAEATAASTSKAGKPPLKEPHVVTLKLGGPTDGGYFAQLGQDPAVFVVSSALADLILQPFANRSLLATPLEQLQRIKIAKRGQPPIEVVRQGEDEWVATGKGINLERAKQIAEAVGSLRATSITGYGNPSIIEGMYTWRARLFIVRKPDAPAPASYEIIIGNDAPRGPSGGRVYVRRTGAAVGLTLPTSVVRKFLD